MPGQNLPCIVQKQIFEDGNWESGIDSFHAHRADTALHSLAAGAAVLP